MPVFFVSGRMQPAAITRSLRMMAAPSCSGVLGKKMVPMSSCEAAASTTVPVSMIEPSSVLRSNTISAPIFFSLMELTERQTSVIMLLSCSEFFSRSLLPMLTTEGRPLRPMLSSAWRISGEKMMTKNNRALEATEWNR